MTWVRTEAHEFGVDGDGYGWLSTRWGKPWYFCWGRDERDTLDGIIILSDSILVEGKYRVGMTLSEIHDLGKVGGMGINLLNEWEEILPLAGEQDWVATFASAPGNRVARYDSTVSPEEPAYLGIRLPNARVLQLEWFEGCGP